MQEVDVAKSNNSIFRLPVVTENMQDLFAKKQAPIIVLERATSRRVSAQLCI